MTVTLERKLARRRVSRRLNEILPFELSAQTGRLSVTPSPIGKPGGPGLWHVKGMGFPPYFQNVRNALMRNGHSTAGASQITWGAIRRWAKGGGNVHPEVRAAARAALSSIAGKEARAHAQAAAHAHANVTDRIILREFAGGDPYHAPGGAPGGGRFTAGGTGPAAPTGKSVPPTNNPKTGQPLSTAQKTSYLTMAASDTAKAAALTQQAAKLNLQITALAALISQETFYLSTAATGTTSAGAGTTAATTATGTSTTAAATGTAATTAAATTAAAGTTTTTPTATPTPALLAQHIAQLKQLTNMRNQLIVQAGKLTAQAATFKQLAGGGP